MKQFLDFKHSWGTVGGEIARELKKLGHEVHLCSTNGYENFHSDLNENIKCRNCVDDATRKTENCQLDKNYDLSISYTMMMHFGEYLNFSNKHRFGIWNLDGTDLPKGLAKYYRYCTRVLPSSEFSKNTFLNGGVPNEIMTVVPHGYNPNFITNKDIYSIKTDRKRKILVNVQQNHLRKNISGILEAWGKAFTDKDDVSMVLKAKIKKTKDSDICWQDEILKMKKRYKNHAPIIYITEYIDDLISLYNACDVIFSASNIECFLLPALEGLAANKIVIASNWGGNVDFMNDKNSLLIKGNVVRAPEKMHYWGTSVYGKCFMPDTNHAAELLQKSVKNYDSLLQEFQPGIDEVKKKYTWENAARQIIGLYESV